MHYCTIVLDDGTSWTMVTSWSLVGSYCSAKVKDDSTSWRPLLHYNILLYYCTIALLYKMMALVGRWWAPGGRSPVITTHQHFLLMATATRPILQTFTSWLWPKQLPLDLTEMLRPKILHLHIYNSSALASPGCHPNYPSCDWNIFSGSGCSNHFISPATNLIFYCDQDKQMFEHYRL